MQIALVGWAVVMLLIALLLGAPLLVILLVSTRTRPAVLSAGRFCGWALACALLVLGYMRMAGHRTAATAFEVASPAVAVDLTGETPAAARSSAEAERPVRFLPALAHVSGNKPDWLNQPAGMHDRTYRVAVKSGLWSTESECRQALQEPIRAALAEYLANYFSDERATRLVDTTRGQLADELVKQPLYLETVDASVGTMQQLHALVEFDDTLRADMHRMWRQSFVSDRLRYAGGGFTLLLASLAAFCGYLKLDLATGGQYTRRLRWASALAILSVAAGAYGICVL